MKKLLNPKLFSQQFGIPSKEFDKAGLLDPFLNADTKLFIDPLLLRLSGNKIISKKAIASFRKRMSDIVSLLLASRSNTGPAWTAALGLLDLHERSETGLGYGGKGTSGSSRPDSLKAKILVTTREIVELGVNNPEIIGLMGMFEDDVGPDTISDLTTNAILEDLQELTVGFCKNFGLPTRSFDIGLRTLELPENPMRSGRGIVLVPTDILRELPVATDWSDIDRVVAHNARLRRMVNQMIANIAKATIGEKKAAMKSIALSSAKNFQTVFNDLLSGNLEGYNFKRDKRSIHALRELLTTTPTRFPLKIAPPAAATAEELRRVVDEITAQFKHLVENNDLSRLLWDGTTPKTEKAAQLVYFGVADSYCKANNIDISPEVHPGGGPVDFKFSSGYDGRLLVEMKLSKGAVVHGYTEQLETYKTASRTHEALFLIVDVGQMGKKLTKIRGLQKTQRDAGQRVSEIVVVDAKRRPSASKRQATFLD